MRTYPSYFGLYTLPSPIVVPLISGNTIQLSQVIASILRTDNDPIDKIENENNVVSPNWLLLPDELWLEVLRYGTPVDRVRVAQTCRHLFRLSMDRSLWRVIHLHRQHNLTDADLVRIGNLKPRELRFTYCRGDSLTASGKSYRNHFAMMITVKTINYIYNWLTEMNSCTHDPQWKTQ
ncbi:unnamed protein product [Trichobilharzia regenti]|nr:unnamed protein product [Trichobilharzia regenti]